MNRVFVKWNKCEKMLPKNPKSDFERNEYLTVSDFGSYQILAWCDGWNCTRTSKENEITNIVAWAELPRYKKRAE